VGRTFPLHVIYSVPGKIYVREIDLINILESCKFREASGRFFGIVEFDIKSLVKKLSKFSIPGFIVKCSVERYEGRIYVSVNNDDVDVLPIIYLEPEIKIDKDVTSMEIVSIVVSNDLLVMLEFNAR